MTTTVSSTIGSTGTYSTWQAWEDACPANLVTADQIWQGQGLNETFTAGAGAVLVSVAGQTTDVTRYVELTTAPGCSFQDNIGTGALRADASYGCLLTSAQDFKNVVSCATNYTRVSKLMITSTAVAGSAAVLDMGAGASGSAVCDVNACIIEGTRGQTTAGVLHMYGSGQIVRNTLVTLRGSGQGCITAIMNGAKAYNCTIAAPSDIATKPTYINVGAYGAPTFQNCALFGATNMWSGGTAPSFATNLTDVASPPAGCTTVTYAGAFVDSADATRDFRITGSSPLDSAAAQNDSTHAATDILGVTRDQPTDIGAYEFIASADVTVSATGQRSTSARGALVPGITVALTGQRLTGTQGSVTASVNGGVVIAITGQRMTAASGVVGTVQLVAPQGLGMALGQGNVTAGSDVAVAISGKRLTLGQGSVVGTSAGDVTVMLNGQRMTAAQGQIDTLHAVQLTGIVVNLQNGTLTASGGTSSIWSKVPPGKTKWTHAG